MSAMAKAPAPRPGPAPRRQVARAIVGRREATQDPRWPALVAELMRLRRRGRHAVRIVDIDCGDGAVLLCALRVARRLGFTAVEGRGIDGSPACLARARAAARGAGDPAVGALFEMVDVAACLAEEALFPADILLWHGSRDADLALAAGDLLAAAAYVVGDQGGCRGEGR